MKEAIYKIFDLLESEKAGLFGGAFLMIGLFLMMIIHCNVDIENEYVGFMSILLPFIPALFFILWLIFALIVLSIEKLIIAPIEFVVYSLGIPKIKINVDVIWKYQQKRSEELPRNLLV